MKYASILLAVAAECWAMQPEKLLAIIDFLALQASGVKFTAEEVQARISKRQEQEVARRQGAIAILPLRGVIANRMSLLDDISGGTSAELFSRQFKAALADDGVKAIVIDTDSPGGAVQGIEELSALIFASRGRKPVVAQVNATAASAAYWIATAADEVAVTPSGEVGSIGVFTVHDDVSAALDKLGIKKTLISAGKYKGEGAPFEPLGEEARAHIQSRVNAYYEMFTRRVAQNRGVSITSVKNGFGEGRMVGAERAVNEGMADRIATLDETLARFGASATPTPKRRAFALEREKRALQL